MAESNRRRNTIIAIAILVIILLLLLLLRCKPKQPPAPTPPTPTPQPAARTTPNPPPTTASTPPKEPEEILTAAILTIPERITAGSTFPVSWTGPNNPGDFVTIVPKDARPDAPGHYQETKLGPTLTLTAPIEPGPHEVRYITARSRTILGRAAIEVTPIGATVTAPAEVTLGAKFEFSWTGPNNKGDYITIVPKAFPDEKYGDYIDADKPSPQSLTAPSEAGEAELRYITGQGKKVLARRDVRITTPQVAITAPDSVIAGATIDVTWTGPNNAGDYITIVTKETPDGQYGSNYTNTSTGSPLKLLTPIMSGPAELRYMTGQGNKVLARRAITIAAAQVTLSAAPECKADTEVAITWTGPNNPGDYITVVTKATPDGQYGAYTVTTAGSPLNVKAPKDPGDAEVRYMTGQGDKVLARIPIKIVP